MPAVPSSVIVSSVPAMAWGPNSTRMPAMPRAMAPACQTLKRSWPSATANVSSVMGVSAELITEARPLPTYFIE